ncbi:MAG: hypothetical protein ABIL09_07955 [Gemmatimonadota bacterium]
MGESALTLGYPELLAETAFALGYGRDPEQWTVAQETEADLYVQSGLRQFYNPPAAAGEAPHAWHFFRPSETLVTEADEQDYDAPDDFGGIEGDMTFAADEGWEPIRVVPEGRIREFRQQGLTAGRPRYVAVRPKPFDPAIGQRFEFMFDRPADGVYNLSYQYHVIPPVKLDADSPYVYGGEAHSETVLASCLAVVELRTEKQKGPMWDDFMGKLAASIAADRRSLRPAFLGYNGDHSGSRGADRLPRSERLVTYNGLSY